MVAMVCGRAGEIRSTGARDSKKLSPDLRNRVSERIMKGFNWWVKVIDAEALNRLMEKATINEIEMEVVTELASAAPYTVYMDSFDTVESRPGELISRATGKRVISLHKADERIPAVSAASIVAKVTRDRIIREIAEKYGDFGSGYPSDPRTIRFLKESMREGRDISKIVRMKWKTLERVSGKDLYDF
ncbi:ribonuclease HII [Thermogymnomonas acidicola]|uniref:Ribonuclease n=1 Tax=Thermogymnomonas acidicola TaxID=399579 RepID=A0AA37BR70_9ARCH|nr:ribonuclease HII [Thermogymnomonas acidicola]